MKNTIIIKNRVKICLILFLIIISFVISCSNKIAEKNYKKFFSKFEKRRKSRAHKTKSRNRNMNKEMNSYQFEMALRKFNTVNSESQSEKQDNLYKFLLGFGFGFGLKVDATEDLKECFYKKKEENNNSIEIFISSAQNSESEYIIEKKKEEQKTLATSFTKSALELFTKFKECKAFQETFFTFVKNKIINFGVKGLAYIIAGPLGLAIKGTYDIYKIISEINNFHSIKKKIPLDYYNLGSSVGKIVYYTQNILLRKRRRF